MVMVCIVDGVVLLMHIYVSTVYRLLVAHRRCVEGRVFACSCLHLHGRGGRPQQLHQPRRHSGVEHGLLVLRVLRLCVVCCVLCVVCCVLCVVCCVGAAARKRKGKENGGEHGGG